MIFPRIRSVAVVALFLLACSAQVQGPGASGQQIAIDIQPISPQVKPGGAVTFLATVTGTADVAVTWSVDEAGGGTVTSTGLYTAPATAGSYHVRVASHAVPAVQAVASVTVTPTPVVGVAISPASAQIQVGGAVSFTAMVSGTSDTAVTWSVQETSGCGSVTQGGVYTAPAAAAQCHVVATSHADGTKSAIATVTVTAPVPVVTVAVTPHAVALGAGQSTTFSATVTGTADTAVTWSVQEGSGCGTVTASGVYTAPAASTTCHVVATSHASPSSSDSATVTVGQPSSGVRNGIGINLTSTLYFDTGKMFADGLRSGTIWNTSSVDSNGWPLTASFSATASGSVGYNEGRWVIYWDGTATVASAPGTWNGQVGGPGGTGPDGLALGPNTRYTNVDVPTGSGDVTVNFTNAARNDGSGLAGLTNIRMMRPVSEGANSAHRRDETVGRAITAMGAKGFSVFRYMDYLGTNSSQVRTWGGRPWQPNHSYAVGDRVTTCNGSDANLSCGKAYLCTAAGTSGPSVGAGPNASTIGGTVRDGTVTWQYLGYGRALPTWSGYHRDSGLDGFGWQGIGGPYEDIIRFSNESGVDPWITVPHLVDDDFLVKLALLFKWGSDGALPYTGPPGSGGTNPQPAGGPLFPGLAPNRNVYIEYSNELWNVAPAFSQTAWIQGLSLAGDALLTYNGDTFNLWNRYLGRQVVKIATAFRAAFGDADMPYTGTGRVRPLVLGQWGNAGQQTNVQALKFIHEAFGDGDGKDHSALRQAQGFSAAPFPVAYYVWGSGAAPYWGASGSTVSDILNSIAPSKNHADNDRTARYVKSFGIKAITYEGGPELPNSALGTQANLADRPASPNMRDTVIDNYNDWVRSGGDLAVYFNVSDFPNSPNNWVWVYDDGMGGNAWNLNSPKMNAAQELASASPVPVAVGPTGLSTATAIPGTAAGGNYSVWWSDGTWIPDPPGSGSKALAAASPWQNLAGYVFLAPSAGNRTLSAALSGGGTVIAFVDGVRIGSAQVANGNITFGTTSLAAGVHGVILVAATGTVTIDSVTVD